MAPTTFAPTQTIVMDLQVLPDFPRSVRHWLPVHVYHAASHAEGHVALLESAPVAAGQSAMIELVLATPLQPKYGDRLVLRDHAMERTIGGGRVIDTSPPREGAPSTETSRESQGETLRRRESGAASLDRTRRRRHRRISPRSQSDEYEVQTPSSTKLTTCRCLAGTASSQCPRRSGPARCTALAAQIIAYHKAAPHSQGLKADQIRRTGVVPKHWLDDALAALVADGAIHETGGHFHAPNHRAALPPEDAALFKRIQTAISGPEQPPSLGDLAKSLGVPLRSLDAFVKRLTKLGFLARVGDHRVLLPDQLETFVAIARRLAESQPEGFDARQFRDAAGIGRNLAIDVLEYFDRCGFTRRYADVRRIVGDPSTVNRA